MAHNSLIDWLNREVRLRKWIKDSTFARDFASGALFAEIFARYGCVDVRHFRFSTRTPTDAAFNLGRLGPAMRHFKIKWNAKRCASIVRQVPNAARWVADELFTRFSHMTIPPSGFQVKEGSVEGGWILLCCTQHFVDAPLKLHHDDNWPTSERHPHDYENEALEMEAAILKILLAPGWKELAEEKRWRRASRWEEAADEFYKETKRDWTQTTQAMEEEKRRKRGRKKEEERKEREREKGARETKKALDDFDWRLSMSQVTRDEELTPGERRVVEFLNAKVAARRAAMEGEGEWEEEDEWEEDDDGTWRKRERKAAPPFYRAAPFGGFAGADFDGDGAGFDGGGPAFAGGGGIGVLELIADQIVEKPRDSLGRLPPIDYNEEDDDDEDDDDDGGILGFVPPPEEEEEEDRAAMMEEIVQRKRKKTFYETQKFTNEYMEKIHRNASGRFEGIRFAGCVARKVKRDAEVALPPIKRREDDLKKLVEINRIRLPEKWFVQDLLADAERRQDERRWVEARTRWRLEVLDPKRKKEERKFYSDLWRKELGRRKEEWELRGRFKDAFDQFPTEDSSDEEVQEQWQHDNRPSKWLNVRWKGCPALGGPAAAAAEAAAERERHPFDFDPRYGVGYTEPPVVADDAEEAGGGDNGFDVAAMEAFNGAIYEWRKCAEIEAEHYGEESEEEEEVLVDYTGVASNSDVTAVLSGFPSTEHVESFKVESFQASLPADALEVPDNYLARMDSVLPPAYGFFPGWGSRWELAEGEGGVEEEDEEEKIKEPVPIRRLPSIEAKEVIEETVRRGELHLPGVRLMEMAREASIVEGVMRRSDRRTRAARDATLADALADEMEEEEEEIRIRKEDREFHHVQEMIRDMWPIPIRKISYKVLRRLLENQKTVEDEEKRFQLETFMLRYPRTPSESGEEKEEEEKEEEGESKEGGATDKIAK